MFLGYNEQHIERAQELMYLRSSLQQKTKGFGNGDDDITITGIRA